MTGKECGDTDVKLRQSKCTVLEECSCGFKPITGQCCALLITFNTVLFHIQRSTVAQHLLASTREVDDYCHFVNQSVAGAQLSGNDTMVTGQQLNERGKYIQLTTGSTTTHSTCGDEVVQ